jgi:putative sigma-54 modulation protein
MAVKVTGRNLDVTQRLEDYAEKKLGKLDRYLPNITDVKLELATEKQKQAGERAIAQLTVRHDRGAVLRAEDKSQSDPFAAIDLVIDKMYRQISRFKGKRRRRAGDRFADLEPDLAAAEDVPDMADENEDVQAVVRRKSIALVPMSEDEAIEQMEMLGHTFFVFHNANSGRINVLYKRLDGNYGVLDPVVE